ncbi:hypothetical protein ACNOYE_00510 [Nannocystaceae bacterium ST9]
MHVRSGLGRIGLLTMLLGCREPQVTNTPEREGVAMREGQAVAEQRPTALYTAKFVIRGLAVDADNLYVSGLRFPKPSSDPDAVEPLPTGVIMKVPLLGVPIELASGDFIPMTKLELVEGRLYWHERDDSPDGPGLRSIAIEGGAIERVSMIAGESWIIRPDVVYFTRPIDEIDEGGFYRLERTSKAKPKLQVRRRGVVRSLLADDEGHVYWLTRKRRDGTWAVFEWDGERSGTELLRSDETFASLMIDGQDFLWVTWAEDEGQPLHSLYRRPIHGTDTQVLARKLGPPGFMEVFTDELHIYLGTVRGGELRRLTRAGGEIEVVDGSGDRMALENRFNLFWVAGQQVFWRGK